jgi:hypothetical protein
VAALGVQEAVMIKATIDRFIDADIFDVSEAIQVYNRSTALIFEHILNHLKVISVLDMGMPQGQGSLAAILVHFYGWPSTDSGVAVPWEATRQRLIEEVQDLVGLFSIDDDGHDQRANAYDALAIPFLDFHDDCPSLALPHQVARQTPEWRSVMARRGQAVIAPDPLEALIAASGPVGPTLLRQGPAARK